MQATTCDQTKKYVCNLYSCLVFFRDMLQPRNKRTRKQNTQLQIALHSATSCFVVVYLKAEKGTDGDLPDIPRYVLQYCL